jgi:CheY-like chemotaxis protein
MSDSEAFRVLVVESDEVESMELAAILSPRFEVIRCRSAEEALTRLASSNVHVVCSNYEVPGMDPTRFLRRVASLPEPPCLLMITSEAEMKGKKLDGLSGVIAKPCDAKALVERVSRLCQVTETRRKVASAQRSIQRDTSDLDRP